MSLNITQALSISSVAEQAHIYYHWLTFCCEFTEVDQSGNWSSGATGTDGIIDALTPNTFYTAAAVFNPATDVGKYIAIRDDVNSINTVVGKIISVTSTTQVELNTSVLFGLDSTAVNYVIFDPADPPVVSDYFVIENLATTQPRWQVKCLFSTSIYFQLAPVGGWDATTTHNWYSFAKYSADYCMLTAPTVLFMVADPAQGWFYTWVENAGSDRNAVWSGCLSPLHHSGISGTPQDDSYAVIFGTAGTDDIDNISRDTTSSDSFCVGEGLYSDNTMVAVYMSQKRFLSSGNDACSLASSVNPRSAESDDYEVICFHKSPNQGVRGKATGVRLLNDNVANRTVFSSGLSYAIQGGLGSIWNGKVSV